MDHKCLQVCLCLSVYLNHLNPLANFSLFTLSWGECTWVSHLNRACAHVVIVCVVSHLCILHLPICLILSWYTEVAYVLLKRDS